jgi:hypothetical protein
VPDRTISDDPEYKALSRIALYVVILALTILGFDIFSTYDGFSEAFLGYVLSVDRSGVKFRALILLAPFILTDLAISSMKKQNSLEITRYGKGTTATDYRTGKSQRAIEPGKQ